MFLNSRDMKKERRNCMQDCRIVAAKDIKVFLRKRYTIYSLVVFPIIIGIGLPFALNFVISRQGALLSTQHLTDLMNAFAFFFAIGASVIPTLLASYCCWSRGYSLRNSNFIHLFYWISYNYTRITGIQNIRLNSFCVYII